MTNSLGPEGGVHIPRVTVGLAVYNGEDFLGEAISSILDQTYTDFELVISDNCSDDATETICREFADRDARVRYFRNPENIGGVRNENRVFFLARGEYFKLAAHDDKVAPQFLERCVEYLDANSEIDLCMTAVTVIDEKGDVEMVRRPLEGTEQRPHQRIRAITDRHYACEATYGLMRSDALRQVRPQSNHLHSDRVMLCELAMRHRFEVTEDVLFFKRNHAGNEYKDWRGRMAWYQPELKQTGRIRLPHWLQLFDFITMLGRSPLSLKDRCLCVGAVGHWCFRMRRSLAMDVLDGSRMLLRGRSARQRRYSEEEKWK